jgi:hypothetical protein
MPGKAKRDYLPQFVAAFASGPLYITLITVGVDSSAAQVWAGAGAALLMAISTWWLAHGQPVESNTQLSKWNLLGRAGVLTLLVFFAETLISAFVLGVAGATIESVGASPAAAAPVRGLVNTVFAIPLVLFAMLAIGYWSAKFLPVNRPARWLAAVVLAWSVTRSLLYAFVAIPLATKMGVALREPIAAILLTIPQTVLAFGMLVAGNFLGSRGLRRKSSASSSADSPG